MYCRAARRLFVMGGQDATCNSTRHRECSTQHQCVLLEALLSYLIHETPQEWFQNYKEEVG